MRCDGGLLRHYNILKQRITTHYALVFLRFIITNKQHKFEKPYLLATEKNS